MRKYALLITVGIFGVALTGLAEETKNLIYNPGFEQGSPSWSGINGRAALDYDMSHQGMMSVKFNVSDAVKGHCITTSTTVNTGKQYRLSCYIKIDTPIDGKGFSIKVLQHNPNGAIAWWPHGGNGQAFFVTKEATKGWVKKEMIIDGFHPATTDAKLYIYLHGKGVVNLDDVSLKEIKMVETLVDDLKVLTLEDDK